MNIKEFIQSEILLPRLKASSGVLVVYDPNRRYRELCNELASGTIAVIDASESSIESRESAIETLSTLAENGSDLEGLLVYIPANKPLNDEDKQRDPFSIYGTIGTAFPEGDGDSYRSLCLKARPDQATEIRRVFSENPNPEFNVIDAIGGAGGWPNLQTFSLATRRGNFYLGSLRQMSKRKRSSTRKKMDLRSERVTRKLSRAETENSQQKWRPISDELWRYLLYSEFVFDLPRRAPRFTCRRSLRPAGSTPSCRRPLRTTPQ